MRNTRFILLASFLMILFSNCKKGTPEPLSSPWKVSTIVTSNANNPVIYPIGMACDGKGNIYAADYDHNRVVKITSTGTIIPIAGNPISGYTNASGSTAQFHTLSGLALDAQDNIYVTEIWNRCIRKIDPSGNVSTFAGSLDDNLSIPSVFHGVSALAVDHLNNVYVVDDFFDVIYKVTPNGNVTLYAGDGVQGYVDGPVAQARFNGIVGLVIDKNDNLYVSEFRNHTIRKISSSGVVSTFSGNRILGYVDGNSNEAKFLGPGALAIDNQNNLFTVDGNLVRKIDPSGTVSTIAGSGAPGQPAADGPGNQARFYAPTSIAVDKEGIIYVGEIGDIRKISRTN